MLQWPPHYQKNLLFTAWLLENPKLFQQRRQRPQKSCRVDGVGRTPVLQLTSCENGRSLKPGNSSDRCVECARTYRTHSNTASRGTASGTRDLSHFSVYYFPVQTVTVRTTRNRTYCNKSRDTPVTKERERGAARGREVEACSDKGCQKELLLED